MDYETLLFDLKPLVEHEELNRDLIHDKYFEVLDQLAVSLRSSSNREVVGSSGLLTGLILILNKALCSFFVEGDKYYIWLKLASSLARCVANCVADNDDNRKILIEKDNSCGRSLLRELIPEVFQFDDNSDTDLCLALHKHTVALVKNLLLENDEYIEMCGSNIQQPLFFLISKLYSDNMTEYETVDMSFELLVDLIEVNGSQGTLQDVSLVANFIAKISTVLRQLDEPEDGDMERDNFCVEIIMNMAKYLEVTVMKNSYSWDSSSYLHIHEVEETLFMCLSKLGSLNFSNKLIIMRRLTTPFGYLSTIRDYSNVSEQNLCVDMLFKHLENGYITSCALLVLSNSITSREDVDIINDRISLKEIIKTGEFFEDPIQYQGYLDILKKLLNLSSIIQLENTDLLSLCNVLKSCYEKSQFFKQLLPLLSALMQKLLATLPSSSIHFLLSSKNSILLQIIIENDGIFSCLALDKLLVSGRAGSPDVYQQLWKSAFKILANLESDNVVPPFTLFQLAKPIAIYLKNCEAQHISFEKNVMFHEYSDDVNAFLINISKLEFVEDKASRAAWNNGKFVAAMIIKQLKQEQELPPQIEVIRGKCEIMLHKLVL